VIRVYFNEGFGHFEGYTPATSRLTESELTPWINELTFDALDDHATCERIFMLLNSDNRPNGRYERSLSVGDVVDLGADHGRYACANCGFVRIGPSEEDIASALSQLQRELESPAFARTIVSLDSLINRDKE
jgi:hypothetical protein